MIPSSAIQLLTLRRTSVNTQRLTKTALQHKATARTSLVARHLTTTPSNRKPVNANMSLPDTVEAIAIDKTGDIDVLVKKPVPFPAHAPGNVVIQVRCD